MTTFYKFSFVFRSVRENSCVGGFIGYGEGWNLAFFYVAFTWSLPCLPTFQWGLLYSLVPIYVPVSELYCGFGSRYALGAQRLFPRRQRVFLEQQPNRLSTHPHAHKPHSLFTPALAYTKLFLAESSDK
jgi:hypothetical protein